MHWLSESADVLVGIAKGPLGERHVDVLVIGSGYGGAVAARRFAEAGERVFVLERGQEYLAGEFPTDLSQAGTHVRAEVATTAGGVSTLGTPDGLFDFRIGLRAGALVGNGLGGGSLINAAVGVRADPRVFRGDAWPAALRDADLDPWYAIAEAALGVRVPSGPHDAGEAPKLDRLRDLQRAAAGRADKTLRVTFERAPLAIHMAEDEHGPLGTRQGCVGCGDCVTGCNHDAKLSVAKSYLPAARRAGARIFTGVTALSVLRDETAAPGFPWRVSFVRTGERELAHGIAAGEGGAEGFVFRIHAKRVVLAAGTFGSTEILLRSRAMGLPVSRTALGIGVSGNGDDLSFAYDVKDEARAVGWGANPAARTDSKPPRVGPCIAGIVRFDDRDDPARSTMVQDGSAPGLLGGAGLELLQTLATVAQLDAWGLRRRTGMDPLARDPVPLGKSFVLLGMGHDSAGGVIAWDADTDRVAWGWPTAADEASPAVHRERLRPVVEAIGGIHLRNPASGVLPESVSRMLSGPAPGGALFTVHPLGGCRMGDLPVSGVVNHWGQAWHADGGLLDGLFVLDGSIVPGSLGANPMLTITALAERACSLILQRQPQSWPADGALPPVPHRMHALTVPQDAVSTAVLSEILRGPMRVDQALAGLDTAAGDSVDAALTVRMRVDDWPAFFATESHRVQVAPTSAADGESASRLVLQTPRTRLALRVESGHVDLFRAVPEGWATRANRYARLACTHLQGRWIPDIVKSDQRPRGARAVWDWLVSAARGIGHATELRGFDYELHLRCDQSAAAYVLRGTKRLEPAATWSALWTAFRAPGWRAATRRSVWDQLTQLDATLSRQDQPVASGRLAMDLVDTMRKMPPQLGRPRDTVQALVDLAGYPLMLLRGLARMRLLDFRAPDYLPGLPDSDPATLQRPPGRDEFADGAHPFPALPTRTCGQVAPERPVTLRVRATHASAPDDLLRIGLVRYRQPTVRWEENTAAGMARAKTIVLLNGFAQNTLPFVAPELGPDALAAMLYDAGWDVWLLEYRVSPMLDASARFSTMDDIAAFDIPAALDHVAGVVSAEAARDPARTQVFAFSHCVGAAALAMSALGGWLRLPGCTGETSRLAGVLFSQFQPIVIGSVTAQERLGMASLLHDVLGRDFIQFAAGVTQPDLLHSMLDRFFASCSPAPDQHCPHEHDLREHQPDTTTCKRMSGLLSPLFDHAQLLPETHDKLDTYFGRTNLGVFLHGAQCVAHERLVNAEGHNAYVTDERVRSRLGMPVMLLHGEDNMLFDRESLRRSGDMLRSVFGDGAHLRELLVPAHAHFDCTIGRQAPRVIFPEVVAFFDETFARAPAAGAMVAGRELRLARTGPIAGWVRPARPGAPARARVWIECDVDAGAAPVAALTELSWTEQGERRRRIEAWPVQSQWLDVGDAPDLRVLRREGDGRQVRVWFAVADVEVPVQAAGATVRMLALHGNAGCHAAACEAALDGVTAPPVFDALVSALERRLAADAEVAGRAAPGTLSRTTRQVRRLDECELRLSEAQLRQSATFEFVAAACRYPGLTPFERDRADATLAELARAPASSDTAFAMLLGDQIYADVRAGLLDGGSPVDHLLPRYRDAFGSAGFRALAGCMPLLMVPDDHEIHDGWTRDDDRAGAAARAYAANAARLFDVFQRAHGPHEDGAHRMLRLRRGDAAFFVLDTRFERRLHPEPRLMRAAQWRRLARWLRSEQALGDHPKFIVSGSVFAPGMAAGSAHGQPVRGTDTWQDYPRERRWLLAWLARHDIRNVVFLSSDYHCSAVARIDWDGEARAWAIVAPALHAPLRFANTAAAELLQRESLEIGRAQPATIERLAGWDGEGWMHAALRRSRDAARSGWALDLRFRLRQLDTGRRQDADVTSFSIFLPDRAALREPAEESTTSVRN